MHRKGMISDEIKYSLLIHNTVSLKIYGLPIVHNKSKIPLRPVVSYKIVKFISNILSNLIPLFTLNVSIFFQFGKLIKKIKLNIIIPKK